jgi:hypothetical protein
MFEMEESHASCQFHITTSRAITLVESIIIRYVKCIVTASTFGAVSLY